MKINQNLPITTGKVDGARRTKESDPLAQKDSVELGSSREAERPLTELLLKHQKDVRSAEIDKVLTKKTKLYADTYGQIKNMALQISSYAGGAIRRDMLDSYGILFTKMEPDTKFTIAVESSRDKADVQAVMKKVNMENPERVKFVEFQGKSLTIWARDQMLAGFLPDEPDKHLLIGQSMLHDWHGDDMEVPPAIAEAVPNTVFDPERRIRTDGGDGVTNTKEEFRGAFSYVATAEKLQQAGKSSRALKQDVVKFYENMTGKHVVPSASGELPYKTVQNHSIEGALGYNKQDGEVVPNPDYKPTVTRGSNDVPEEQMWLDSAKKLFEEEFGKPVTILGLDDPNTKEIEGPASDHVDMACTPIDDQTFLLGDPELAKSLIKSMTPEEKKQASERFTELRNAGMEEDLRLLKEDRVRLPGGEKEKLMAQIEQEMKVPVDIDKLFGDTRVQGDKPYNFTNYKNVLEQKGYEVDRVPHLEPRGGGPYLTKNNSVSERFTRADGTEVRRVFLPHYGIPKIDNYAKGVWQKHNFEVIDMPLGNVSTRWGALRCISQWLERSPQG